MDRDYYSDISNLVNDTKKDRLIRIVHSTIIYCICYILVNYANQYGSGIAASFFGYQPDIKYFGIYNLPISPNLWTKWSVLFVFATGPMVALALGLLAYQLNLVMREYNTTIKVFALWIAVHGMATFGSYCITSSFGTDDYQLPFYYGFAVVASWLRIAKVLMVPVTLMGMVLMIIFGLLAVVAFLSLANNRKLAINYQGRRQLITQVAIMPWIIGTVLCVAFSLPPNPYLRDLIINLFKNLSIFFIILGMWFRLDYIVGSIQVHSFDVFKNRPWLSFFMFLALLATIVQRHVLKMLGLLS